MANQQQIIESLQKRLRILEDKDELTTLLNRYCKTADDHKWRGYAECFVPDGSMCFENWGEVKGRDKIEAASGGAEDRFQGLQHTMTNMQFTLDGDKASATAYLWFSATMDVSKPREHYSFGGHYTFDFVRTSEGWLITRMNLKKMWAQNEDTEGVFGS